MTTVKMYQLRDHRKPSCSDSGTESTADEYDSMGSTGDSSSKRKMRGEVKRRGAGQKKEEEAAVPLQKPKEKKTRGRVKSEMKLIVDKLK